MKEKWPEYVTRIHSVNVNAGNSGNFLSLVPCGAILILKPIYSIGVPFYTNVK